MEQTTQIRGFFQKNVAPRLWAFFLASACFHAALLAALGGNSVPDPISQTPTILSVALSFAEPPGPKTRQPRVPSAVAEHPSSRHATRHERRSTVRRIAPQPPPMLTPRPTHAVAPVSEPPPAAAEIAHAPPPLRAATPNAESTTAVAASAVAQKSARTHIRTLLLADLARRFTYPPLAQRRGWQGMVMLAITLGPNGTLEHIHVAQSSGYDVLDSSALSTVRRVGQLANVQPWLRGQVLELLLPVVYRLTD